MLRLNKRGFSLIEIMLVICIFACAFSVLKINTNRLREVKKDIELNKLVNDLETYRDKALIDKMNIEFRIGSDKRSYVFSERGGNKSEFLKRELESGYKIYHNNSVSYIVFKSTGSPSKGVSLTIRDGKELNYIIIQPVTGNIRVEKMSK